MLRPKDITDQLGISPASLRFWSNAFAPVLSPGAQASRTEHGGNAQRRYTDEDLAILRQAKTLLDGGSTFELALEQLKSLEPIELLEAPEAARSSASSPSNAVAVTDPHPIIQAFEEALRSKDQVIAGKDETIRTKDELLVNKDQLISLLSQQVDELKASPAVVIHEPRFRWGFLNRLLTEGGQDVG